MKEYLENGIEYSREELQSWFETKSRICSTPLWHLALKGRVAFEVGDHTFRLTPTQSERYLMTYVETSTLITKKNKPSYRVYFSRLSLALFLLGAALVTAVYISIIH